MSAPKPQKLELEGNELRYRTNDVLHWALNVGTLILIAEFTTDEGPLLDDYFLVFVTRDEHGTLFHTGSFYADGVREVLAELQKLLKSDVQFGLCNSTEWNSRILWPPAMAGRPYFTFREVPAKSMLEKLRKRAFGRTLEYFISDEVKGFLRLT